MVRIDVPWGPLFLLQLINRCVLIFLVLATDSREFDLITSHIYDREDYEYGDLIDYIYENPKDNVTGELLYIKPTYPGPYAPLWQVSPPPLNTKFANHDKFDKIFIRNAFEAVKELRTGVYTDFFDLREASSLQMKDEVHVAFHQQFTNEKLTAEMAYEHVSVTMRETSSN